MSQMDETSGIESARPIHGLRREASIWLAIGLLMAAICYLALESVVPGLQFPEWLPVPIAGTIALWRYLVRHLPANRRSRDDRLLPHFGLGNSISIFRGLELIVLAGFLLIPRPAGWTAWIPALLYTSADILDYVDGYTARVRDEVTRLGEELDQLLDGAGLLIATLLAIRYGTIPWWFLPIGAARFLFLAGIWTRERRGLPVYELTESRSRRPIAGLTMGFMTAMLWPIVEPPASTLAGLLFMLPFGASFVRDWLVVSGTINPQSDRYLRLRRWLEVALIELLPVVVRFVLAGLLASDLGNTLLNFNTVIDTFAGAAFPAPKVVVLLFSILKLAAIPLLLTGTAGRFVAFTLIFPIGLTSVRLGLTELGTGMLIGDLLILILGTGRGSIWEPSKRIFVRRVGGSK
jgi:CDP-diacylglycerol--glycerol-3-phosphate 3-phosphatidyltransferase